MDVRSTLRSPLSTMMAPKTEQPETRFATDAFHMRPLQQSTKTVSLTYKSKIDPALVHTRIFDAIRAIDDTDAIIIPDNRIIHSKDIPSGVEYEQMLPDIRTVHIIKRIFLAFTSESTHAISQLKYGSKYDGITGIFDTLRESLAIIKIQIFIP